MITKNVVGKHPGNLIRYLSRLDKAGDFNRPILNTFASDDPIGLVHEAEAWGDLNQKMTRKTNHVIFSQETVDRPLTPAEWQKAVSLYIEARGQGDAPYCAWLHDDHGSEGRLPHLHVCFSRTKSDGSTVPDSKDADVNRATSRAVEKEFGLQVNEGKKYSGSNKNANRERSAERNQHEISGWQVDPNKVNQAIERSSNIKQLRGNLRAEGIEIRTRSREGFGVYAWSLRNVNGPKEWTSGSKITPGGEYGWAKVQARLDVGGPAQRPLNAKKFPKSRMKKGLGHTPPPRADQRLDQAAESAMAEASNLLSRLISAASRANSAPTPAPEKPGNPGIQAPRKRPVKPATRPTFSRPRG